MPKGWQKSLEVVPRGSIPCREWSASIVLYRFHMAPVMCCEDEMKHHEHAHSAFQGFSRASQLLPAGSNVPFPQSSLWWLCEILCVLPHPPGTLFEAHQPAVTQKVPRPNCSQMPTICCWLLAGGGAPKGKKKPWLLLWELSGQVAVFPVQVLEHLTKDTSLALHG